MYVVKCVNVGSTKDSFLTQVSEFALLFGNELDAEVQSSTILTILCHPILLINGHPLTKKVFF